MNGGPFVAPLPAGDTTMNWSVVLNTVTLESQGADSVTITGSVQHVRSNVADHVHGAGPTANFNAVLRGGGGPNGSETLGINPGNVTFSSAVDASPFSVYNGHDGHWDTLTFTLTEQSNGGNNIASWALTIEGEHTGVPTPAGAAVLAMGGVVALRRRRPDR